MNLIASWRIPHYFTRLAAGEEEAPPTLRPPVFTYGLLSVELASAVLSDLPAASSRIGYEWLASLADRLRRNYPDEGLDSDSPLTTFIKREVGIARPGQESGLPWIDEQPATVVPREILDAFAEQDVPRLQGFVRLELQPLVEPLSAVAKLTRPDPVEVRTFLGDGLAAARHLLSVYGPAFAPSSYRTTGGKTLWGLTFANLAERIAIEVFELYALRPTLRRCEICRRVFVPRKRGESMCRGYLWEDDKPEAIELCISADELDARNERVLSGTHKRERRRLWMRWRRELEAAGGDETNPRVKYHRERFVAYMDEHRQRWRERPAPSLGADVLDGETKAVQRKRS